MVARFPHYVNNGSAIYTFTVNKDLLRLTDRKERLHEDGEVAAVALSGE